MRLFDVRRPRLIPTSSGAYFASKGGQIQFSQAALGVPPAFGLRPSGALRRANGVCHTPRRSQMPSVPYVIALICVYLAGVPSRMEMI